MRILMISRVLRDGEAVSEYLKSLSDHLTDSGDDVYMTASDDGSEFTVSEEVDVRRTNVKFEAENIYDWAMIMNNEIKRVSRELFQDQGFDVIHANDWCSVPAGITISSHLDVPLVVTVHSTENERGFQGEHSAVISDMEWKGGYEADRIIALNDDTKNSLVFDLDVPDGKINVIDAFSSSWREDTREVFTEVVE